MELLRICDDPETAFYGPHECPKGCGKTVCRAALEQGGMMFEYPEGIIYPNTNWVQHVCNGADSAAPNDSGASCQVCGKHIAHDIHDKAVYSHAHDYVPKAESAPQEKK